MTTWLRRIVQGVLGLFLCLAGVSHLTFLRAEFDAQVPPWLPLDTDFVVLASGVVEIAVGATLLAAWRLPLRAWAGTAAAILFVAIFPGNISQFVEQRDAFGLTTDLGRGIRLLFQPVLIVWALWSTEAWTWWRQRATDR